MLGFMRRSGSGRWFPCPHQRKGAIKSVVTLKDEEMDDEADVRMEEKPSAMPERKWRQLVGSYQVVMSALNDKNARETIKEFAVCKLEPLWREGLIVAAHQLGKCYRDGLGVTSDKKKAVRWFRHAADAGLAVSQYALGKLLQQEGQLEEAVKWYKRAAAQGNRHAQHILDHWDNDHHHAHRKRGRKITSKRLTMGRRSESHKRK